MFERKSERERESIPGIELCVCTGYGRRASTPLSLERIERKKERKVELHPAVKAFHEIIAPNTFLGCELCNELFPRRQTL